MTLLNDGRPFLSARSGDVGLSRQGLRDAVHAGAIRRVMRGVVVDGRTPDDRSLRVHAAGLVLPAGAAVSDHWAAWIWGVDTFPPGAMRDMTLTCVVQHGRGRPKSPLIAVRQTTLPYEDARLVDGVLATSPVRTCADLLRRSWRPHALAAGDALVRAGVVSMGDVGAYLAPLTRLPYMKQAKELAPLLDARADGHGESWMRLRMIDAGLPIPLLDHAIRDSSGRVWRLDSYFEAARVAVGYDGREHHTLEADRDHDGERRLRLSRVYSIHFEIAVKETVFGDDPGFEQRVGVAIGCQVRPRFW